MNITLEIDNDYDDGVSITTHVVADVPELKSLDEDQVDDWADDYLRDFTGTGRFAGNDEGLEHTPDAMYTVKIRECPDEPSLVGKQFEFGL